MNTLYFILFLVAFLCFAVSFIAALVRRPLPVLLPLGLAIWVLVYVIQSGRRLNNAAALARPDQFHAW